MKHQNIDTLHNYKAGQIQNKDQIHVLDNTLTEPIISGKYGILQLNLDEHREESLLQPQIRTS